MTTTNTHPTDMKETLRQWSQRFEANFARLLEPIDHVPAELVEAVRYAALNGGKRLRPFLLTRCCIFAGGTESDALPAAAAIECVHVFSLVHDDLPAMDNDDVRRGRPTCHRKFGEAAAILAGDALLTLAFELIVTRTSDPTRAAAIVAELARGTGWSGMIGGQTEDLTGENQPPSRELTERIHRLKTAALLETACRMGVIAAGGDRKTLEALGRFGQRLGLCFQIADDLLDVTASQEQMGKGVGKDAAAGKQTYPRAIGIEASRIAAMQYCDDAVSCLADFGPTADDLRALAIYVIQREH